MSIHFSAFLIFAPLLSVIWADVRHSDLKGGLRRKSQIRAAKFSWERRAPETSRVFKETVAESGITLSAVSL
jgi:hypothetical protein